VFIDSNIPMYVAGRDHPNRGPASAFLRRVRSGEIQGVTNVEVLQEILHRYNGMGRPDLAADVYRLFVQICLVVFPVTLADTDRALEILRGSSVSSRDAVHAAVMQNHEISQIATFDAGFNGIPGITRLPLV